MKTNDIRILQSALLALSLGLSLHLAAQTKDPAATPSDTVSGQMGLESAELLRRLDADRNGFISQREWNDFFTSRDQDGDGRLAPEEIESSLRQARGEESLGPDYGRTAAFERLDVNGNDSIDASEWPGRKKDFLYLDANLNNLVSREEFLSRNGRYWNQVFENLDFNDDKIISRSEWLDSKASFDRLDRDRNGVIVRSEFYRPR